MATIYLTFAGIAFVVGAVMCFSMAYSIPELWGKPFLFAFGIFFVGCAVKVALQLRSKPIQTSIK